MDFPKEFDSRENCFIMRIVKTDKLVPRYLYYVFEYLNLEGTFNNMKEITKTDLRNIPIQATENYNQKEVPNPPDAERLGDLIQIIEATEEVKENDVLIRVKGNKKIGEVKYLGNGNAS